MPHGNDVRLRRMMMEATIYRISATRQAQYRRRAIAIGVIAAIATFFLPILISDQRRGFRSFFTSSPDMVEVALFAGYVVAMGALLTWGVWRTLKRAQVNA